MSAYQINKVRKYYDSSIEDYVPEVIEIELVTADKERALKRKQFLMKHRSIEEKRERVSYIMKTVKKADMSAAYGAYYKQGLLAETIPNDLMYRFGDKIGASLARSLVDKLRNESYEDLYYWDVDKVTTEEKFNESISISSHVCSRSTHISAKVDINGKIFEFSAIDFHGAFRV